MTDAAPSSGVADRPRSTPQPVDEAPERRDAPKERSGRSRQPRIAHVTALDGLRGVAVAAVLLYHGGYLTGGYLGVDLFFVLSGFLITALLLEEHRHGGSIDLIRFWIRRARRLLPALLLMMLGVALFAAVWARPVDLPQIRTGGLWALVYASNWYEIARGTSYWDLSLAPSPVAHLWSLAVEEQFYLVWPIVAVVALRGRSAVSAAKRLRTVAIVGAVGSALLGIGLYLAGTSVTLIYESTFTRAVGFLLGGIVACTRLGAGSHAATQSRGRARIATPWSRESEALGLVGAVGLLALWAGMDGASPWPYRGGLVLASVLGVLVVAGASRTGSPVLGRVLSLRALCWLGLISYGVYLWHWPVFLVVTEVRTGISGIALFAIRLGITLGIALLSYELVERPIRSGRTLRGSAGAVAVPAAGLLVACSLLLATSGAVATEAPDLDARRLPDRTVAGAPRVLFAGDSVAGTLAEHAVADPEGFAINPINEGHVGCDLVAEGQIVPGEKGEQRQEAVCSGPIRQALATERPDLALIAFGGLPIGAVKLDGAWRHACDPPYERRLGSQLRSILKAAHDVGAVPVLTTTAHSNNPFRNPKANTYIDCVNEVTRQVVEADPDALLVDIDAFVCPDGTCLDRMQGEIIRPDSVHYLGPGGRIVAQWYVAEALDRAGFAP